MESCMRSLSASAPRARGSNRQWQWVGQRSRAATRGASAVGQWGSGSSAGRHVASARTKVPSHFDTSQPSAILVVLASTSC